MLRSTRDSLGTTATREQTQETTKAPPESENKASGANKASFEAYAAFQQQQPQDAVGKTGQLEEVSDVMGALGGPMGAYAILGTEGSELQRRIIEILAAAGAYSRGPQNRTAPKIGPALSDKSPTPKKLSNLSF